MIHLVSTQTPLRVGFFGGGTDLPEISTLIGGAVLNMSIKQYVYVTVKRHSGLFHEKFRLQYSSTERCADVSNIKNDIIRTCLQFFDIDCPLLINTVSDLPSSSGLGSSSSFTVGLINAFNIMFDLGIPNSSLAEKAFEVERSIKGSAGGRQDIYAAATGGLNLFEFGSRNLITPVHNCNHIIEYLLPSLKLFWTGIQRSASKVLQTQIEDRDKHLDKYSSLRDLAIESYDLLSPDNPKLVNSFASLLNKNREIKYQLSKGITSEKILKIEKAIMDNGAISTKLLGAGGGGFILAVFTNRSLATEAVNKLPYVSLNLEMDLMGTKVTQTL